jgi:signal transduction histidine kinase
MTSIVLAAPTFPSISTAGESGTISVPAATVPNAAPSAPLGGAGALNNTSLNNGNNSNAGLQFAKIQRQVIPQNAAQVTASLSNTVPEESDFRRLIGAETSGALARFLENKLRLMVWSHATAETPIVFGAQLDQGKLVEALKTAFQIPELAQNSFSRSSDSDYCAAILDDTGHPVALSRPGFKGDWKHPFVATEIGEALPHWEAALYLVDPQQISRAARTLQLTLGLIVLLLVAAIVSGGSLIAADVRRQVRLAQQKTDFVSNVSHELKTPLTSIRMFADMLAEKRVPEEEKRTTYLRIISAEAARLTRLINNVLDFARLERGAPGRASLREQRSCDLVDAVRDIVETCQPHLEAAGVSFQSEIEAETLPITGDRDALAQIILNLVSNAEKYGGNDVLVRVRRQETSAGALGCVDVLDRGPGIPPKQVKTVFEPFHRLDDSLSSGIPGSGLGLTLARRMARAHGGDVTYSPRAGGGSCFTLSVPLRVAV